MLNFGNPESYFEAEKRGLDLNTGRTKNADKRIATKSQILRRRWNHFCPVISSALQSKGGKKFDSKRHCPFIKDSIYCRKDAACEIIYSK